MITDTSSEHPSGAAAPPFPLPDPSSRPEDEGESTTDDVARAYKVELDVFEGPMDLLLYLVKRDEIDIYDISIERITTQYMAYLDTFRLLNISLAGEFLVMAANLCFIKSRTMLPRHVQQPEEELEEEDDPRWDLIRQLIEYKKFKDAAAFLGERESEVQNLFRNTPEKIEAAESEERPLSREIGIFDLIRAFQSILDRFNDEGLGEIVDDHFTVSDKIDYLLRVISPGETVLFTSLFEGAASKSELIVTFLALLELMKINFLRVRQESILGEIKIERPSDSESGLYHQPGRT